MMELASSRARSPSVTSDGKANGRQPLPSADLVLEGLSGATVMHGAHINHSGAKPAPSRKGLTGLRTSGC